MLHILGVLRRFGGTGNSTKEAKMKSLIRIVFVVLCLTTLRVQCQDPLVIYTHTEEQPRGTFVGNIRYDMLLRQEISPDENTNLRFRLTNSSGSQAYLFTINETSSTISTTRESTARPCVPNSGTVSSPWRSPSTGKALPRWTCSNCGRPFAGELERVRVGLSGSCAHRGAVDPDTGGNNSVQAYRLTPLSPPTEGLFRLSVVGNLDGSSDLEIVINQESYNASVEENVGLQTPILQVMAVDDDIGDNARIKYVLSPRATDIFLVEARNEAPSYWSTEAFVVINVLDTNDNAPQISINLSPDGTNLLESEPVGKFVAHVSVSDLDDGDNGRVSCSVDDPSFSLENLWDMYKVILSMPLDYEAAPSHRVTITCRDHGQPALSSSASFIVQVLDVNDLAPIFSKNIYTSSITENSYEVQKLLQVSARDPDTDLGGEVEYFLEDNARINLLFFIDPSSGILQARAPVDREETGQFTFSVLARDKGTPQLTSTATIIITVEDENDERPRFVRPLFNCYVLEKQPVGTRVGNVTASDDDTSQNARMKYSIVAGIGDGELFTIEPNTGEGGGPTEPAFYDLANVSVQVLDDNDNRPVIEYPREGNNTVIVAYNTPVGSVLAVVRATDTDDGPFGQLIFLIAAGDTSSLFDLNRLTGVLRLGRMILSSDVKEHVLQIKVQDGGNPPIYETETLHVVVTSGNATLLASSRRDTDQNILIVIILICVTAIMAIAIVTTICLIRRIDRERRQKRALAKVEEEKMFHLKNQDTFANISPETSTGSESSSFGSGGNKNKKKEVSFSIDDGVESLNMSSGSAHTIHLKPVVYRLTSFCAQQEKNCLSVLTPSLRGEPGMLNIPVNHRMSADDNHLQTVHEEEACQLMEMLRRNGEDAMSASSGETGTSDSGRGGSEDDSHSNRGSGLEADAVAMYPMPPVYAARGTTPPVNAGLGDLRPIRTRHSGRGGLSSGSGRVPRQHLPHVSFNGNLEYLGESSTDRDDEFPPSSPASGGVLAILRRSEFSLWVVATACLPERAALVPGKDVRDLEGVEAHSGSRNSPTLQSRSFFLSSDQISLHFFMSQTCAGPSDTIMRSLPSHKGSFRKQFSRLIEGNNVLENRSGSEANTLCELNIPPIRSHKAALSSLGKTDSVQGAVIVACQRKPKMENRRSAPLCRTSAGRFQG
ncbi:hypothetical protein C0Q70_05679 [Pomacea canaliculata]|uniref:Cadherin domain-containing protein n=1 Tax=Pomacea canaliculata TaxID=400727 RepID=A0A2T7PLZ4_POMCA|nr:hypothetical protein C0Q70_05679 [Pomacea canaliculata]